MVVQATQRGRCEPGDYSSPWFRSRGVHPDYGKTFTESLILAQDERWRRA